MAKKVLLDNKSESAYYTLLGISCHHKDYRLSFLLNQVLESEFLKMDDLPLFPPGTKESTDFSFYFYRDEDNFNSYFLISNRSQENTLVPSLKQVDFLLLIEGPFKKVQKDSVLKKIKSVPNILTAFEIDLASIKNYENLLSDIEMHCMHINMMRKSRQGR